MLTASRGSSRLALTDEDREGRDLVVTWMHDLGLEVADRRDRQRRRHARRHRPDGGAGDDRQPHRHRAHRRPLRRQPRRAGRPGGGRDAGAPRRAHPPPRGRRLLHQRGGRPLRSPTCSGSLVYVGGLAVEEALDVAAIDGPTLGDELRRIGYAGPVPCPAARSPHAFVELHIEQGPVLEAAGVDIGAVTGVQGISWQRADHRRPVEPRRHHADGDAPRRRLRGGAHRGVRAGSW